tara:strand:- start:682 stop:1191 length:510 start_codon:yes stop_codon:yes gene_type:complete
LTNFNPLQLHLSGEKKDSIRKLSIENDYLFKKKVMKALSVVTIYYPEFASQAANQAVVEEFMIALAQRYPDYLADELEYVFRKKIISHKVYGQLRLVDLFAILDEYQEERSRIREENHQNQKVKHNNDESKIDYKAFIERKAREAKEKLERELRDKEVRKKYKDEQQKI